MPPFSPLLTLSHVSCLTTSVSCLQSTVSHLLSAALGFLSVSPSPVLCLLSQVFCLSHSLLSVSCLLSVSRLPSVSRLLYVSCLLSHISCGCFRFDLCWYQNQFSGFCGLKGQSKEIFTPIFSSIQPARATEQCIYDFGISAWYDTPGTFRT